MNDRLQALNRFGLGARIGEVDRIDDPRAWLLAQVSGDGVGLPGAELPEISRVTQRQRQAERRNDAARQEARRAFRDLVVREMGLVLDRRVVSDTPLVERLVAFWSNHLCVSAAANPAVAALAGHYERTAIRPHVLGRFDEMLLASARHPAMLIYLDNARSIGPNSLGARAGRRRGPAGQSRPRGLNENYARELLELHTLGVDGGYTQSDVEQLAKILTGWTVDFGVQTGRPIRRDVTSEPLSFRFVNELHEPGSKTVLGTRAPESGEAEGVQAIRMLAGHPSTARFIGEKLARHFVSDEPPVRAVNQLARAFHETNGDLLHVTRTLIELDEAWDPTYRKFRAPQDWLVASLRAVGVASVSPQIIEVLRAMRQPLWAPPAPKGYDDLSRAWADPDSLMNRAEFARSLARRGSRSPAALGTVVADDGVLGQMLRDEAIASQERVALAIASPAFQWR